jgi:hypothetical protein
MGSNPIARSTIAGVVMQSLMVIVGNFVPAVGAIPNFYAIAGTLLSVVTGFLFSKWSPGAQAGQAATGGAIAGGGSSIIGGVIAVVTGQWPGFQLVQLAFPAISGAVGGGLGALVGRMMSGSGAK